MNNEPHSLTHGALTWTDELPIPFKGIRLPGSNIKTAFGKFGSVCIQEFHAQLFSIRFIVFDLLQRFILLKQEDQNGFFASFVTKGKMICRNNHHPSQNLNQNQFMLFEATAPLITIQLDKDLHISFDTFFSPELTKNIVPLFPSLKTNTELVQQLDKPKWADAESLEIITGILRCKYETELRRYFFESRVRDLFFKYLVICSEKPPLEKEPNEKELNSVYKVEKLITADVTDHIHIEELSKRVMLNEFTLKRLFKKIFGFGPYEYLVRQRMKKAKELLEAGLSVKEVAAQTGYRSTDFIIAFRQHYGFTPGSIKKRGS